MQKAFPKKINMLTAEIILLNGPSHNVINVKRVTV